MSIETIALAVLAALVALGGMLWRALAGAKKAGVDQERSQALQQQATKVSDANQARAGVGDSDVERLLTNPRDRH